MNIYVSNLSFNTNDAELNELFQNLVLFLLPKVILDRETGRSRVLALFEMPSNDEGKDAMLGLNNKEVEGRAMSVSVAKEREERSSGGSSGGYSTTAVAVVVTGGNSKLIYLKGLNLLSLFYAIYPAKSVTLFVFRLWNDRCAGNTENQVLKNLKQDAPLILFL